MDVVPSSPLRSTPHRLADMLDFDELSRVACRISVAFAQKCLDARGVDCQAWEKEIDKRVAALYGL